MKVFVQSLISFLKDGEFFFWIPNNQWIFILNILSIAHFKFWFRQRAHTGIAMLWWEKSHSGMHLTGVCLCTLLILKMEPNDREKVYFSVPRPLKVVAFFNSFLPVFLFRSILQRKEREVQELKIKWKK